ncbi:MAG: aminoglycoside phosphotransferase [Hydrocarboniphaga sp.]|uniref:aminoglycoside phosphotransferase family protein n=1 Tax=Hydrocarboniphaga sp. TaxID=2033016 RepID=UPI002611B139|nr:phosphotransferase [Hydrocarboniphaga sp.]MDB5972413.1 aminoglycoside phosphotransferase [Hydrocarboniphaga sp.]
MSADPQATPGNPDDPRRDQARDFALQALVLSDAAFEPASTDASFRRYFRLSAGERSWIVMDAPPAQEDCAPFIRIAGMMEQAGLHVPKVLAQDLQRGYLLLSDLGRQTWLNVISEANADALFASAIDALLRWQLASKPGVLPAFDEPLLRRELALFPDWYVARHLRSVFTTEQSAIWNHVQGLLVKSALAQPQVYVHRDYMPRNLMLSTPNPGVLDFQDAVYGPISYDAVSLLKDAFLSWPQQRVETWARQYWQRARDAGLPVREDFDAFFQDFEWMGVQRHLKVLGIFARIHYRDGKPKYLADTPRFVRYLRQTATRYAGLAPLLRLFDELGLIEG